MSQKTVTYADAGVSIDNANLAVAKIREYARSTFNERTLTEIGSFGGMFAGAFPNMSEPILVASADGVGTKLKLAFDTGIHNTVGADLVNHCVNDILVQGARPLFFLDYFATGKLEPDVTASVVEVVSLSEATSILIDVGNGRLLAMTVPAQFARRTHMAPGAAVAVALRPEGIHLMATEEDV